MNNFLREARKFRNITESLCIILGNETCDLDSAVSSLSLAYFFHKNQDRLPSNNKNKNVLPIFNIPRKEFPIKTEVTYFLNSNSIDIDLITFKDEIDETLLKTNDLILVDHHVSPYPNSVISVYDHRPYDDNCNLSTNCIKNIKLVGSCSTLIADHILDLHNSKDYIECLRLLYGAIILDTVCFSKKADKATTFDSIVAFEIENLLQLEDPSEYREILFENLVRAKNDISKLDSYQILYKDMKIIKSDNEKIKIALPGYPILVKDYVKMENAEENLKKFAETENVCIVLLMGMQVNINEDDVKRDLGLINISNDELFNKILDNLKEHNEPNLQLKEYENCEFLNGRFFEQNNIKASRKQIVPIIKTLLNNFKEQVFV